MSNYKRKEVMDYLTRKPVTTQDIELARTRIQIPATPLPMPVASNEERVLNTQPFYQEPKELVQDDSPSPQVDSIPLYQGVQPGVAIQETMPIYLPPDMSPVMPQVPGLPDTQFRQIELATGGRVELKDGTKEPPKFIPMDLESVAFRLFQDNLDNLSYNQKQTVYDHIEDNRNKKAKGGIAEFMEGDIAKTSTNINKLSFDSTGISNFLETSLGQTLSKTAPNFLKTITKLAAVTGTPLNALLGVVINAEDFKEQGLSDLETIAAGAYKGATQDLLNFGDLIFRKLPAATYEKFVQDKPFLESLLNKPEYFEFADRQIDRYTSEKSIKDRIQNRAEYEVRKSIPINISDTEVSTMSSEEFKNLVENKKNEISNLTYEGRAKFAEGSGDPENDLYIPPLNEKEIFENNLPKVGIDGLYFGTRQEPREIPVDSMTGKPISSGGMRELKQVFSSLLSDTRPEAGYRKGNIDLYASKGINPFQGDTDFKYGASYTPEGNVGKFMIDKTPQNLGAGYFYQKDGLDLGITGLKDQMGDKSISLRLGYKYAKGGKIKK